MIFDQFETTNQFKNVLTLNKKIFEIIKKNRERNMKRKLKGMEDSFCPMTQKIILFGFIENIPFSSISLIYKASVDGFLAENFHEKCDHITGVLVLIKANDFIFGI